MAVQSEPVRHKRFNWPVWLRTVHFYASTALFAVFLFYAVTGFMANRLDIISPEDKDPPARTATVAVPSDMALDGPHLVTWAQSQWRGEPDKGVDKGVDDDGRTLTFRLRSAWHEVHVRVDKSTRQATVTLEDNTLAESLVNLHRARHATALQKLLIDVTALLLLFVTLTGMIIGLVGHSNRRRMALALMTFSIVILMMELVGR